MKMVGEKVVLRDVGAQDQELLQSLICDPEIVKVTGGYGSTKSFVVRSDFGAGAFGGLRKIIADQDPEKTGIGILMLSHVDCESGTAEVYIKLARAARGKGYGQDAVSVLIAFAFEELGLNHLCANILEHNTASRRLFEACGFRWERTQKARADQAGRCKNVCCYGIWREHWRQSGCSG